jgi:hypothetical protein
LNHVKLPKEKCSFDLGKKPRPESRRIQKNAESDQEKLLLSLTETAKKHFSEENMILKTSKR